MIIIFTLLSIFPIVYLLTKHFLLRSQPKSIDKSPEPVHIVITGGSKGIGKALAEYAVRKGAHVSLIARDKQALTKVHDHLTQLVIKPGQQIRTISLDLCENYEKTRWTIRQELALESPNHIPIDILVNNAGRSAQGSFDKLKAEDFEHQIKLNYLSAVYVTKSVIDRIKERATSVKRGCRIVFLSSQAGQVGIFGYTAYSPSKFALIGFAQSLQSELLPYNVWITVVYPPNTKTEGFADELLTMPHETKLISGTAGLFEAEDVARKIWHDTSKGNFTCSFGVDGWMLKIVCSGMNPHSSFFELIQQICFSGLLRLVALFHLKHFDKIVHACVKR